MDAVGEICYDYINIIIYNFIFYALSMYPKNVVFFSAVGKNSTFNIFHIGKNFVYI